ncbi:hypothetical protein HK405_005960 [Cladochytrium tenue]|nr:hypothetical protein HK405_005960 [Cladochytrium tenue]
MTNHADPDVDADAAVDGYAFVTLADLINATAATAPAEAFLDHLGAVFGQPRPGRPPAASPPRGLFADHWHNDPAADPRDVFLAIALPPGSPEAAAHASSATTTAADTAASGSYAASSLSTASIAASVRIYRRALHLLPAALPGGGLSSPPAAVPVGAIGDVATQPTHRGKGLARALLRRAHARLLADGYVDAAVLHAAQLAMPLYASLGYRQLPVPARAVAFRLPARLPPASHVDARPLRPDAHLDLAVAAALHARLAPAIRGSFARPDPRYWRRWVAASDGDSRCHIVRVVLPPVPLAALDPAAASANAPLVAAYAIFDAPSPILAAANAAATAAADPTAATAAPDARVRELFVGLLEPNAAGDTAAQTCTGPAPPAAFAAALHALLDCALPMLFPASASPTPLLRVAAPAPILPPRALAAAATARPDLAWLARAARDAAGNVDDDGGAPVQPPPPDANWMARLMRPLRAPAAGDGGAAATEVVSSEELAGLLAGDPLGAPEDGFGFFATDAF